MSRTVYAAFLRGINVGGNTLIKMNDLKKTFESLGFENVVPVLASGNVVFESAKAEPSVLKRNIEDVVAKRFKVQVKAILRTAGQLLDLLKSNPFKADLLSAQTKLHVTFISDDTDTQEKLSIRHPSPDFQIVQIFKGEILSVVDLSKKARTPELMSFLEKRFGKGITTRTWNTIEKIGAILSSRATDAD